MAKIQLSDAERAILETALSDGKQLLTQLTEADDAGIGDPDITASVRKSIARTEALLSLFR